MRNRVRNLAALIAVLSATHAVAQGSAMDEAKFWEVVDAVRQSTANVESRPAALQLSLSGLPPEDIQKFQRLYEQALLRANRWSLWGAAYLMNGGCSDDCFKYFRDWLISEGRAQYERALLDPDSLGSLPKASYFELESFGYAALKAYTAKTGKELDRSFEVELARPAGSQWSEADLPRLFPKLAARYSAQ